MGLLGLGGEGFGRGDGALPFMLKPRTPPLQRCNGTCSRFRLNRTLQVHASLKSDNIWITNSTQTTRKVYIARPLTRPSQNAILSKVAF